MKKIIIYLAILSITLINFVNAASFQWNEIHDGGYDFPVMKMCQYNNGIAMALFNGAIEFYDGNDWSELLPPGQNYGGISLVPYNNGLAEETSIGDVLYYNGSTWSKIKEGENTPVQGKLLPYNKGLVLLSNDGSIDYYDGNQWTVSHGTWGSNVTLISLYNKGIIIGLDNGEIDFYDGNNWNKLLDANSDNGSPTSFVTYKTGFIIGFTSGKIEYYNNNWIDLQSPVASDSDVSSIADYLNGFIIAMGKGEIAYYDWTGWTKLNIPWSSSEYSINLLPYDKSIIAVITDKNTLISTVYMHTGSDTSIDSWVNLNINIGSNYIPSYIQYKNGYVLSISDNTIKQLTITSQDK